MEAITSNSIISFVIAISGVPLTLIGIYLAFYFYKKSKTNKDMSYAMRNFTLLEKKHIAINNLKVSYEDTIVETLTASKVLLWNSGNSVIEYRDFSIDYPLTLKINKDCKFFSSKKYSSNRKNGLKTEINGNMINIYFEYLSPKEAILISCLHNDMKKIRVEGDIKGYKILEFKKNNKTVFYKDPKIRFIAYMAFSIFTLPLIKENILPLVKVMNQFQSFILIIILSLYIYAFYIIDKKITEIINSVSGTEIDKIFDNELKELNDLKE